MSTLQVLHLLQHDPFLANFLISVRVVAEAQRRIYLTRLLNKSKAQILLLKNHLRGLMARYKKARRPSLIQNLAIRIDVTEGMRNMMYETARAAADELSDIYWRTTGDIVLITVDFDDEDDLESDEDDDSDDDADFDSAFYRRI